MVKIKRVVQDCIAGCTANNANENRMHFNVNYYLNSEHGKGTKHYLFVYDISDLENCLYELIRDNISKDTDVVISAITIKHHGEIIKVNKDCYAYSLSGFIKSLLD